MGDISSTSYKELVSGIGKTTKVLEVWTPATADTGDTIAITLADYAATKIVEIIGSVQTTAGSVVVQEQPTTSVTTGTLTITVGGSTVSDKARFYTIKLQ